MCSIIMLLIVHYDNILNLVAKNQGTMTSPFGSESYSYFDVIQNPKDIIKLFTFTFTRDLGSIIAKAFARIQYIEYPILLVLGMILCIIMVLMYTKNIKISYKNKFIMIFNVLIVSGLLFASAIAWTKKESLTLMGVQGRYFIPVLPICFLLLKSSMRNGDDNSSVRNKWILLFFVIEIIGIWMIFDKMMVGNYDSIVAW